MNSKVFYAEPKGTGDCSAVSNAGTLKKALELAKGTKDAEIRLAPGVYEFSETLKLGADYEGIKFYGDNTVFSGGRAVTNWEDIGDNLVKAKLSPNEIPYRLYINGTPHDRAKFPIDGFFTPDGRAVEQDGWANSPGEDYSTEEDKSKMRFNPGEIPEDEFISDSEFVVLQFWCEARLRAKEINREKNIVSFTGKAWRPLTWCFGWYIDNCPKGISVPGSWYYNKEESAIIYHLQDGETKDNLNARIPLITTLIEADFCGNKGPSFYNITFADTNPDVPYEGYSVSQAELCAPNSLEMSYTQGGGFFNCKFEKLGGYAINYGKGCHNGTISRCTFKHCGAGAIRIGNKARSENIIDRNSGFTVENCKISDCAGFYLGPAGIWVGQSSDNNICHNDISGAMQWAISVGWNWRCLPLNETRRNRVEYNFVHEVGTGVLGMHGALYFLGASPETVISHNYVKNVYANEYWGGGEGIIFDNGCSGISLRDNVVVDATAGGWGSNFNCFGCMITNNIFAFGEKYVFTRYGDQPDVSVPPPNGEVFSRNIVLWENNTRFFAEKDWLSYSTFWDYNLYWHFDEPIDILKYSYEDWQKLGFDNNTIVADPKIADVRNDNFTLSPDSPAFSIGFEPIDLSTVGVVEE